MDVNGELPVCIEGQPLMLAGGLQQYLIKNMKKDKKNVQQAVKGAGSDTITFHDLPDSIHLHILSYLTTLELCRVSQVCCHWYCIASDNILWQNKLDNDIRHWNVISHLTNPEVYKECNPSWTNKEIYLRCCPVVNQMVRQKNMNFHQLSNILRTLWPKKTPRIAMFGPGLESKTSRIARRILEDKSGMFKTTGMFPGQFEGHGSGFTMKMGSTTFHLMTLYTSSRQERESRSKHERLQHSRLLAQDGGADSRNKAADGEESTYEVTKAVKDLCLTLDAFIFVIDASEDEELVQTARAELLAMVNDRLVGASVPVVILSCIPDMACSRIVCIDVVHLLRLTELTRPWQVRDCNVDINSGIQDAIEWVVEQAHRTG